MMKKICPVCDLPISTFNYCPRCRRMVRHPLAWDTDYYLNEASPVRREEMRRTAASPPSSPARGDKDQAETARKMRRSSVGVTAAVMIIAALLNVAQPIFKAIVSNRNIFSKTYETAYPFDDYGDYSDSGYLEFDETEVREAGESCTQNSHFPVDGELIADYMGQYIRSTDFGYTLDSEETYSDNYGFDDESGYRTYFETTKSFYLTGNILEETDLQDDFYEYLDLNYDTGTGALHYYASYLKDSQASLEYLKEFLFLAEEQAGISPEESSIPAIMEQAEGGALEEEGIYILEGLFDISIYQDEGAAVISASYNDPQPAADQEV